MLRVVAMRCSVIATTTVVPAVTLPKLHEIAGAVIQVPWLGVAAKTEAPLVEKASETITCETVELPLFVTVIRYPALEFGSMVPGPVSVSDRSATLGEGGAVALLCSRALKARYLQ